MSSVTFGESDGATSAATDVTAVPSPASSTQRVIKKLSIYNGDTAQRTVAVKYNNNGTKRTLRKYTIDAGGSALHDDCEVLDATNKLLMVSSDATAASTEPTFVASWADHA